jgi:hypothetical protein
MPMDLVRAGQSVPHAVFAGLVDFAGHQKGIQEPLGGIYGEQPLPKIVQPGTDIVPIVKFLATVGWWITG